MAKLRRLTDEDAIADARANAKEYEEEGDYAEARMSHRFADALKAREDEALQALATIIHEQRQEKRKSAKAGK